MDPALLQYLPLAISILGWGVVWGRVTQRLKTVEESIKAERASRKELEKAHEVMKAERQDIALAVARLEVKLDGLTKALDALRNYLDKNQGLRP